MVGEKGNHPFCLVRRGKKKGCGLLVGHFYTILKKEVGRHYVITWLLLPCGLGGGVLDPRRGAVPD
jgi:hypothetical protein